MREIKKRVEFKLGQELVDRLDRVAELLEMNRTDIIRSVCFAYLENMEIGAKKLSHALAWARQFVICSGYDVLHDSLL